MKYKRVVKLGTLISQRARYALFYLIINYIINNGSNFSLSNLDQNTGAKGEFSPSWIAAVLPNSVVPLYLVGTVKSWGLNSPCIGQTTIW